MFFIFAYAKENLVRSDLISKGIMFTKHCLFSSGDEVKFDCLSINGCFKPLDVKFQGFLYFSYISDHERGILASKKFNGTLTDCQNSECKFNLDEKYKRGKLHFIHHLWQIASEC